MGRHEFILHDTRLAAAKLTDAVVDLARAQRTCAVLGEGHIYTELRAHIEGIQGVVERLGTVGDRFKGAK